MSIVKPLIFFCLVAAASLAANANPEPPEARPTRPRPGPTGPPPQRAVSTVEDLYIDATGDGPLVRPTEPSGSQPTLPALAADEDAAALPAPAPAVINPALAIKRAEPAAKPPLPSVGPRKTAPSPPDIYVDATEGGPVESNAPFGDIAPPWPAEDFAPVSQAVVLEENPMSLYFELAPTAQPLQGSLLRGKGFRVWADWRSSSNATLRFYFQQLYRGLPLNEWSGGQGYPGDYEKAVDLDLPAPDGEVHRVFLQYDLRSIHVTISNATTQLAEYGLWRDNMTETLGPDGPDTAVADHPAVANVTFVPGAARPSRYVWEGVIGNTSRAPVGPSVHSPWWPISKMVSRGNDVFYTGGYNEGKWDVQKFDISNPQVVVTNFSPTGRKQLGAPFPIDMTYFDARTIALKYNDGNVVAFDAATTATLAERLPDWTAPAVNVPTNGSSAVAVHPDDNNIVAVYYHTTDQVVVYTNAATTNAWGTNFVIGVAGGYRNGPAILTPTNTAAFRQSVKLSGHYFDADGTTNRDARIINAVLCFQSDGKLWVGDALTSRMLRFDAEGLCDSWFMFVAHTYVACADLNDPTRVFAGYLEFEVDYTKPIASSWTLKNYWGRYQSGDELERAKSTQNGLFSVVTLTNDGVARTYALARDPAHDNRKRIVELTPSGIRPTYINNQSPLLELEADGSTVAMTLSPTPQAGTTAHYFRDSITAWQGGDPVYTRTPLSAVEYIDGVSPIYWGAAKLRGSKLFLFYPGRNQLERDRPAVPFTGQHLGAVEVSNGSWLWMNSPTGPLDGRGTFETNCHYAGSAFTVIDDNIFFIYRGEGWRHGQANQIFHYKTDGTFVGQFGTPAFVQGTILNAPGAGANVAHISAAKVNGVIYLYTSDEWSHGVHRWRIEEQ